jgi:hypothetical protein
MRMRVRPGSFDDGAFEEVAYTLDVTRKAFYFHTASDRYRAGMRLRVNFPYDPNPHSVNGDDFGEVVRVEPKRAGFGVAIVFWKRGAESVAATRMQYSQPRQRSGEERRSHERQPLVAAAELIDLPTGMRTNANTSDVSFGGCYVNTLNPFRLGATLRLKIEHGGERLEAEANVCTRFEGSGMGLAFRDITAEQATLLAQWLPAAEEFSISDTI